VNEWSALAGGGAIHALGEVRQVDCARGRPARIDHYLRRQRSLLALRTAHRETPDVQALRRTQLHDRHAALGARFSPFAGFDMPLDYGSISSEHRAVRERAGVFDVSHMGQLEVVRVDANAVLQSRLSNDLDRIATGEAQYTLLTNAQGGVIDDLIAYRRHDGYLLVVNAANVGADAEAVPEARDVSDSFAMLAVQGPDALALLQTEVAPFTFRDETVLGIDCILCGTGYTGERGCELLCAPSDAGQLWDRVVDRGIVPCGLGARDSLRLEACYPLHGQELTTERTPLEADLAWACALDKEFPGVDVLRRERRDGPSERLVAFVMDERAVPRAGMRVEEGGEVTSGGWSPMLEAGIGLAYVTSSLRAPGTSLTIDVRGRPKAARVHAKPVYRSKEA
jgi:aminomethyltransferase